MNVDTANTVIFDLDGTLIDSAPVVADLLNRMRKQSGKRPLQIDFYRARISCGATELVSTSMDIDIKNIERYVCEFRENYFNYPTPLNCLYDGVIETTKTLSGRGVKLGVCSNKPEHLCRKIITEIGIDKIIDVIVGGDTLSVSKPYREPLDYAINKLGGFHQKSMLVGDSTIDQRCAMAANIPFIFFRHGYLANRIYVVLFLECITGRGGRSRKGFRFLFRFGAGLGNGSLPEMLNHLRQNTDRDFPGQLGIDV